MQKFKQIFKHCRLAKCLNPFFFKTRHITDNTASMKDIVCYSSYCCCHSKHMCNHFYNWL